MDTGSLFIERLNVGGSRDPLDGSSAPRDARAEAPLQRWMNISSTRKQTSEYGGLINLHPGPGPRDPRRHAEGALMGHGDRTPLG